jgi:hypothetical protein
MNQDIQKELHEFKMNIEKFIKNIKETSRKKMLRRNSTSDSAFDSNFSDEETSGYSTEETIIESESTDSIPSVELSISVLKFEFLDELTVKHNIKHKKLPFLKEIEEYCKLDIFLEDAIII